MAKIEARPRIELTVSITLDEEEARAIDALVGYGDDAFIRAFRESLGKAYLDPHEAGLRRFFTSVRSFMPGLLSRADDARKSFEGRPRT